MNRPNGLASGTLMLLAGVFLVLRTVRRPEGGRNLVDLILGDNGAANASANAAAQSKTTNLLNLPKLTPTPQGTRAPTQPVRSGTTNTAGHPETGVR
jgi:hypothetical protein